MFYSTKRYGHEIGLSTCFRQWKATSHCNQLHGYSLAITLKFGVTALDSRDWVVDFGALKPIKKWLEEAFDHKTVIALDDPALPALSACAELTGAFDIQVVPEVGCEAFAFGIAHHVAAWLEEVYLPSLEQIGVVRPTNLYLHSVEVSEHGANSAIYVTPIEGA